MHDVVIHDELSPPTAELQSVVIIAPRDRSAAIEQALAEAKLDTRDKPAVVSDPLMAVGHVAQVRPSIVIATAASMNGEAAATGAALRRVLPTATLLLVGPVEKRRDYTAALDAGFDHYLPEPLDSAALRTAVRHAVERRNTAAQRAAESAIRPRHIDAPATPATPTGPIGDVDLVDQLVRDPRHMPDLAVRLISQQSSLGDVAFARNADAVPSDHARAAVTLGEQTYGFLHAPKPASSNELARWADWLSHWMAMQQHLIDLWQLALKDELTGVWNRRYFNRFLSSILQRAVEERFRVTVLVFDIDDFKLYNDRYGHAAGDDILRETARLMQSVVRDHDVVARIGGDEFAVIFWDAEAPRQPNSQHPVNVRMATERFQRALCTHKFPKLLEEAHGTLTISAGLAGFPWDGRTPDELLAKADEMAMRSKRQGKDAVTFGPGAMNGCEPETQG